MGSGKTTVGSIVAERMGRPLVDSDEQIERQYGETGLELAEEHGVPWLHAAEAEALRQALKTAEPSVIAAAASTGDLEEIETLLSDEEITVVLLVGDVDVLTHRAKSGKHRRPIDVARSQELAERRNERLLSVVDGVIDVTTPTPEEIAQLVLSIGEVADD
jgi:shikimate kinase